MASDGTESLQLPPLRSLDDFLLGSARFQLPNLKDLDKWGNRVVKNLLYYQTNYFLMFIAIYTLMIILHPTKIITGLIIQALILAAVSYNFGTNEPGNPQKKVILSAVIGISYIVLYWLNAVLLTLFTLLLPFSMTFVHSSLRLRNIRNKVVNSMESFSPRTPMGHFLEKMNITSESILS